MTRGDDRVLTYTRVLAAIILPFLFVATFLLFVLPGRSDELFAWTVDPPLTAMFLASAYLGGIWFFVHVIRQRQWHRIRYGFPAVFAFVTLLSIATFLHLEEFHEGDISFILWLLLYVTMPFLVLAALLANLSADSGKPEARDFALPMFPRVALAIVGFLALIVGLILFIAPSLLAETWAWPLTPLNARIIGAVLILPGMVNLWMLFDSRWTAFRWVFQAQIFSLIFVNLAFVFRGDDLDWARVVTPVTVIGFLVALIVYVVFYVWAERKYHAVTG